MSSRVERRSIASGSPFEQTIAFLRAVRVGDLIAVSGTALIGADGVTAAPGDVYHQTARCLEIVSQALVEAGSSIDHVIGTRVLLRDITRWEEAACAHAAVFYDVRPACTFVEVSRFIDPNWLVEIEADATSAPCEGAPAVGLRR